MLQVKPQALMFTLLGVVFIWSQSPLRPHSSFPGMGVFILYHHVLETYKLFIMLVVETVTMVMVMFVCLLLQAKKLSLF